MTHSFRDLSTSTRWLRGLLLADTALSVVSIAADLAEGVETGLTQETLDLIQLVVSGLRVAALLATFIVAGIWIYRAACNARTFASNLTITPGWAVGWYFVPIANLFKPFQAMSEIWRASANPVAWLEMRVPAILRIWWGLWLVGNILDLQVAKQPLSDGVATMGATLLSVTSDVVDAASNLVFFAVVGGLWRLQDRARLQTSMDQVFSTSEAFDAPKPTG